MLPSPTIFGHSLSWFPLFHWSGVLIGYLFGIWYYRRYVKEELPFWRSLVFLLLLMPLALVGSRVAGSLEAFVAKGEWLGFAAFFAGPSSGQFRWAGTVLTLALLAPLIARWLKLHPFPPLFDVIVIALCPLTAVVKQGCLFSGDGCYGIPTTLPWGMFFPHGPAPNILPAHPTPLYDGIFHLLLFAFLWWWDRHRTVAGQTAALYFILVGVFYILLECIRLNPPTPIGLTVPQVFYLICIFIGSCQLRPVTPKKRDHRSPNSQFPIPNS